MLSFILFLLGFVLGMLCGRYLRLRPSRDEGFFRLDRSAVRRYDQQYFKRLNSNK